MSLGGLIAGELGREELETRRAFELGVLGLVHDAHPALTEFFEDLVVGYGYCRSSCPSREIGVPHEECQPTMMCYTNIHSNSDSMLINHCNSSWSKKLPIRPSAAPAHSLSR